MSPRPLMEAAELSVTGEIWGCSEAGHVYAIARGPMDKRGQPRMPIISHLHKARWRYGEEKWWCDCSHEEQVAILRLNWIPARPITPILALARAVEDP